MQQNIDHIKEVFSQLADQTTGKLVFCAEDPVANEVCAGRKNAVSYGWEDADYTATDIRDLKGSSAFTVKKKGVVMGDVELGIPGNHNILNALAAKHHVYAPLIPGYGDSEECAEIRDMLDFTLHTWDVVAALGLNYYDLGRQTGKMVVRILNGEAAGKMPSQVSSTFELHVNPAAAQKQGIALSDELLKSAKVVIR